MIKIILLLSILVSFSSLHASDAPEAEVEREISTDESPTFEPLDEEPIIEESSSDIQAIDNDIDLSDPED